MFMKLATDPLFQLSPHGVSWKPLGNGVAYDSAAFSDVKNADAVQTFRRHRHTADSALVPADHPVNILEEPDHRLALPFAERPRGVSARLLEIQARAERRQPQLKRGHVTRIVTRTRRALN